MPDISKIQVNGTMYDIKDAVARAALKKTELIVSTDAATTPKGVTWDSGGTTITGTLEASDSYAEHPNAIYLVPSQNAQGDTYDEYVVVKTGSAEPYSYAWEKIGNTDVDLTNYVQYGSSFTSSVHTYTPSGTISTPTFTGDTTTFTIGSSTSNNVTITSDGFSVYGNQTTVNLPTIDSVQGILNGPLVGSTPTISASTKYTPQGSIDTPSFTGATGTITLTGTIPTKVNVVLASPSSTIVMSGATFSGTQATVSVSGVPSFSVTPSHISPIVSNETLVIQFATPTTTSFNGEFTPEGNVNATTVSVLTGVSIDSAYLSGDTTAIVTVTGEYRPQGTITQPVFTGTEATITVTGSVADLTVWSTVPASSTVCTPNVAYTGGWKGEFYQQITYTPSGTISQPSFTGQQETHSHTVTLSTPA